MASDPARLHSLLLNTGLQIKDNALYQVINQLISSIISVTKSQATIGINSSTIVTIPGIIGPPGMDGLDNESDFSGISGIIPVGANPTNLVGLSTIIGTLNTFMRSDAAPGLNQTITPVWTGSHVWQKTVNSTTSQQFKDSSGNPILNIDSVNVRVGIGTQSPEAELHIVGQVLVNNGQGYRIKNVSGTAILTLYIDGSDIVHFRDASNVDRINIDTGGNIGFGAATPRRRIDSLDATNPQLRLTHTDNSKFVDFRSLSTGDLTLRPNGSLFETFYVDGGLELGSGSTSPGTSRLALKGGTAATTNAWALTSGWGANATITAVSGNDSRGTVTVTTDVLDTPTVNPVITYTFKDSTWTTSPFAIACMNDTGTGLMGSVSCHTTTTTLVIQFNGTPTALQSKTYIFNYHVLG